MRYSPTSSAFHLKERKISHRSIIVKLQTMFDKNLIFKSAKNPKEFNAKRKNNENFNLNTYITDHLPEKFQR